MTTNADIDTIGPSETEEAPDKTYTNQLAYPRPQ